jgi:hypothetical protein
MCVKKQAPVILSCNAPDKAVSSTPPSRIPKKGRGSIVPKKYLSLRVLCEQVNSFDAWIEKSLKNQLILKIPVGQI